MVVEAIEKKGSRGRVTDTHTLMKVREISNVLLLFFLLFYEQNLELADVAEFDFRFFFSLQLCSGLIGESRRGIIVVDDF